MNGKRLIGVMAIFLLLISTMMPVAASANTERTLADESIYDLLVDRFNNGVGQNDIDVDVKNGNAFNGGDFIGVEGRLQHIIDMGFTVISLGPVFKSETYDGNSALSYTELEPHFGTAEELESLVEEVHEKDMKIIADFPLGQVSADHEWAKGQMYKSIHSADGTVSWDLNDTNVQEALIEAAVDFVKTYNLDGLRLTKLEGFDVAYLNEMIDAIRDAKPGAYVMTNEESEAAFDLQPNGEKMEALRQSFVTSDPDSSSLDIFNDGDIDMLQFDDLTGPRMTYDMVEARMFPPTRWNLAATALFTLPGIPLLTYGTEIAVNGKEAPDSHPLLNFKTDMELKDHIDNLNFLRNESDTLRHGDFEMLHNEDGFIVYTRSSEDETWLIAINNTSKTVSLPIPADKIGENKKLRGVLDSDLIRESEDGTFIVVLDREMAEMYIADEDKGFNIPYLIATILVYVLFLGFLYLVFKKGRDKRRGETKTA